MKNKEVTVYSCSGCSNVAQLANSVAVRLHREKIAKMSCIAGVGGDVASLVNTAQNAEKIFALDGCPLACVANCLKRHGITPDVHLILTGEGLSKNIYEEIPPDVVNEFFVMAKVTVEKMKIDNDDNEASHFKGIDS